MKHLSVNTVLIIGLLFILGNNASGQDFKYIGASKCKMCHNKAAKGEQYNKWLSGPHSKAMQSLKGDEVNNPECLKCHSTAGAADPGLIAGITKEEGVSCESCHGPGSAYKSMSVMKDHELSIKNGLIMPTEAVCKKCHNEESPNYKGFNFEEYYAKIAHPNPASN
ncbi:MAG: cytochrome C554 [Chlorobi bacterium]|nr:cytochrome C554 [Chlorobiota bacterium]